MPNDEKPKPPKWKTVDDNAELEREIVAAARFWSLLSKKKRKKRR
jgi:hypothetical protein